MKCRHVERFIQFALRKWAYDFTYQNMQLRTDARDDWVHHCNWQRSHRFIGELTRMSATKRIKKKPRDASQLVAAHRR
jgi:hypothetical protein